MLQTTSRNSVFWSSRVRRCVLGLRWLSLGMVSVCLCVYLSVSLQFTLSQLVKKCIDLWCSLAVPVVNPSFEEHMPMTGKSIPKSPNSALLGRTSWQRTLQMAKTSPIGQLN